MLYAEDLAIGQRFPFRNYLLEESEIIDFARRYDPFSSTWTPRQRPKARSAA
jgi:hypothetical protein